jgi:hypothetical protein
MAHIARIPEDAQLPQLPVVTNTAAMQDLLQRRLPGFVDGRLQIGRVKLEHFRYKPGEKCRLSYNLRVKDLRTGSEDHQVFFGVIVPNGGAEAQYAKAQRETYVQPKFGPAVFLLPELNMVLWGFPNDPKLKPLSLLLDNIAVSALFRKNWHALDLPPAAGLISVATKVVKHAPHDRCTLRHTLQLKGNGDLVVYSKTFAHQTDGERIFKTIHALWQAPISRSGEILIPEPLFFEPEMNTLFLRGLEGVNADENPGTLDLNRIAAASGVALAGIHCCLIEFLPIRSDEYVMSRVAESEEILGDFDTAYKPRLEAIARALREKSSSLAHVAPTPIHGAFRLSQLLLVEGKLALIDFDDFLLGNPISDVASFVAHLLYLPLKGEITPEQSRSAIRHFCRAYADGAPQGLPADVLTWQTAAQLVCKQAKKCVKLAKRNCRSTVDQLLNVAADILNGKMSLI